MDQVMSNLDREWDDNAFPTAYLITIRTFGTWLHGDERGSVDRHGKNIYGTPKIAPTPEFETSMSEKTNYKPFLFNRKARSAVEKSIREVCKYRAYSLHAVNVRTNHVHAVISAQLEPEKIINTLKSYATRKLRTEGLINENTKVWSRGGSRQYLWKPNDVGPAMDYVLYGQGDVFWK
jgi:REP element-mobilizing transposase RayT